MPRKKRVQRPRKDKRLSSIKKLLKSEEFQDFMVRVVREIIHALK